MHECARKTILRAWKSVHANIKFVKPWRLIMSELIVGLDIPANQFDWPSKLLDNWYFENGIVLMERV